MKEKLEQQAAKLEKELSILKAQIDSLPAEDPYKKFKDALAAGHIIVFNSRAFIKGAIFDWSYSPNKYRIIELPEGYTFWGGGENPCHPKDIVHYIMRSGERVENEKGESQLYCWHRADSNSDIVAYRIVKKHIPLPDIYTVFQSSETSVRPEELHGLDEIEVLNSVAVKEKEIACNFRWRHKGNEAHILGYRIIKKHKEPRPMTFAEIPVGVFFMSKASNGYVYLKISNSEVANAFNTTLERKDSFHHSTSGFYKVEANFSKTGSLMTVSN